jgi:hypothetical protein
VCVRVLVRVLVCVCAHPMSDPRPTKVRVCDPLCDPKVLCECPSEYVVVCVYVCVCMRVCICVCCANECGGRTRAQPFHLLHVLCGGRMFEFSTTIDNSIYARYLNPLICSYFLSLTHIHAHIHNHIHTHIHIPHTYIYLYTHALLISILFSHIRIH